MLGCFGPINQEADSNAEARMKMKKKLLHPA
jgi:hypothetical protein